jgi:hypothetical protein
VSDGFLRLLEHQLAQFADCPGVRSLVVYVAHPGREGEPQLLPVGRWPTSPRQLTGQGADADPHTDAGSDPPLAGAPRQWLPLRDGPLLLGVLLVESGGDPWGDALSQRLRAVALCLTEALQLDQEASRLRQQLNSREEQLRLLVHQLRNPLTALRTFGQLLLRRLGPESEHRSLVEGLLAEERQLNRYVDAISDLARPDPLLPPSPRPQPLLLPPLLNGPEDQPLAEPLAPLLERAAATAALQGRPWQGPAGLPDWRGDSGAVAEIVANLLENAFRYSPQGSAVGLHVGDATAGGASLSVWDDGPAIAAGEREAIFRKGVRGSRGLPLPGTGLGLALARDLARQLGGSLELLASPRLLDQALPAEGNAFRLTLPPPVPTPLPSGPPPRPH